MTEPIDVLRLHPKDQESNPDQNYIGFTSDLKKHLIEHNTSRSIHTAKFAPWSLLAYFAFQNEATALAFEKHLKSGSGRAFAGRHFP